MDRCPLTADAEQDALDKLRLQEERAQREEERAVKEAELDEKETEYIRQMNAKEINEDQFWELVVELDLERAMGESIVEGLATMQVTTQDEEVGESEREESTEEEPAAAEKAVESTTVGKGKRKAALTRAKVYAEVDGLVSVLLKSSSICTNNLLTVQPMFHVEDEAVMHHKPTQVTLQEVSGALGGGGVARSLRVR
jgi:hypothetical protein